MATMQVLAATLTIAFEGLMLLQGPRAKEKTHAMIVDAPHHHAYIEVNGRPIDLYKRDVVSFSTGAGVAKTDDQFDQLVITLKDHIFFGNIDQEVGEKDVNHDGTRARIDLPNGELTTLYSFPDAVELDSLISFSSKHCFPRYVVLTTQTHKPITVTITHGSGLADTYESHDGIVVISNGGPQGATDTHFHEYRRMTARFSIIENARLVPSCNPYEPGPNRKKLDPEAVRVLTERINRIPNGDCGVVDNP